MMTQTHPRPRPFLHRRDTWLLGGFVLLLGLGLWSLLRSGQWAEAWAQARAVEPMVLVGLLGLSLCNYLARTLRWHIFARRLGLPLTLLRNGLHFVGGFAMAMTPGHVGELVRLRWIARESGWAAERAAPLVLADRASDIAAMALLLLLGVTLSAGGVAGVGTTALPVALLGLLAAVIATRPALLARILTTLYALSGKRAARLFARARGAAKLLGRFSHGPTLALGIGAGLLGWATESFAFHWLLGAMGAEISLAKAMTIFIFATLAGGLTGAPGGVGGAEAAMVALLTLDGVEMSTALAATAIIRLTTLWFAIALGLVAFPLAERHSLARAK